MILNVVINSVGFAHISPIYGLMIDPHNGQLAVGLIAPLMEHCTCIAEIMVQVLFRPEFFRPFFRYFLSRIAKL